MIVVDASALLEVLLQRTMRRTWYWRKPLEAPLVTRDAALATARGHAAAVELL